MNDPIDTPFFNRIEKAIEAYLRKTNNIHCFGTAYIRVLAADLKGVIWKETVSIGAERARKTHQDN